jgi:peptide/nickel transport system ATP-binding protein
VRDLTRHFEVQERGGWPWQARPILRAVDGVSLSLAQGETLGLVGETGCGKSTLARLIVRLDDPTGGQVIFEGQEITRWSAGRLRPIRRHMQIVFQDPYSSLNPRQTVHETLVRPLRVHGLARDADEEERLVRELLGTVGLGGHFAARYPHELSGGQRQRVGIARALIVRPRLIVADEPVSALDVSIQAQILNLLRGIQQQLNLAMVFISHDLSVVRHMAQRIAVMYLGRIVELGPTEQVFRRPSHPYTRALLSAVPVPNPRAARRRILLPGEPPNPIDLPTGCRFEPRCPLRAGLGPAAAICATTEPGLDPAAPAHWSRCHFASLAAEAMNGEGDAPHAP